jgi:hypothetical protein
LFGGRIAGHIVGEFPHTYIPGEKDHHRINAANPGGWGAGDLAARL